MLSELEDLYRIVERSGASVVLERLAQVEVRGDSVEVVGLRLGAHDPAAPCFGLFGGVHGLERVGSQTVLAYLAHLLGRLSWDRALQERLERVRLVAIPIINPGGMLLHRRSNPSGVDLMRNAPVDAPAPVPVLGGHRLSPRLPWYRGRLGAPLEPEAAALVSFVERQMFTSAVALSLDVHSGFGARDRLWYPFAREAGCFPRTAEAQRLGDLLSRSYPHHVYSVEPQALSYTTHGDLWDHLFDRHRERHGEAGPVFVPWTLEMGSWSWVRKNPRQLLSRYGIFHPRLPHRLERVLRRHLGLIDFMLAAVDSPGAWAAQPAALPRTR